MKVLQVVENLHRGAVETWLVRMFAEARAIRPQDEWTFYCTLGEPGRHDDTVRALGGHVVYSPFPLRATRPFLAALRGALRAGGYDVLHCHHDLLSSLYLWAAWGLPIRRRLVHVHNTDEALPTPSRWKRALLKEPMRQTCLSLADKVVGISRHVLAKFCRGQPPRPGRDEVLYYGCDFSAFSGGRRDGGGMREQLGLPSTAKLVLFLGRLEEIKNPLFALEVFAELAKARRDVHCLLAGTGPLAQRIGARAAELGLGGRVRLLGWLEQPAECLRECDLFLFPRQENNMEGFGLAVLEAQAAGLPVLTSHGVSEEVLVAHAACRRLELAAGCRRWAQVANALLEAGKPDQAEILDRLKASPFALRAGAQSLLALYPAE